MSDVQHLVIEGKRFVVLPELEYEAICREAGRFLDRSDLETPQSGRNVPIAAALLIEHV